MSGVITGAMSKIYIDNQLVGIFDTCTIANTTGTEGIFILGRMIADQIAITHRDLVTLNCSGFRVAGHGKHTLPKVPKIQDLLNFQPFTMTIVNRQTGETLETVFGCVPNSDNTNYNAKTTSKVSVSYVGIRSNDESGNQDETGSASFIP